MVSCRIVDFFYALIPAKIWRDVLIRGHIECCPHCRQGLAAIEEVRKLLVQPDAVGDSGRIWTGASRRLEREERVRPEPGVIRRRRLAWSAMALLVVAVSGIWLVREFRRSAGPFREDTSPNRFEIRYIRVGGETAQFDIYRPQGSDTVFVWAGKNSDGGEW